MRVGWCTIIRSFPLRMDYGQYTFSGCCWSCVELGWICSPGCCVRGHHVDRRKEWSLSMDAEFIITEAERVQLRSSILLCSLLLLFLAFAAVVVVVVVGFCIGRYTNVIDWEVRNRYKKGVERERRRRTKRGKKVECTFNRTDEIKKRGSTLTPCHHHTHKHAHPIQSSKVRENSPTATNLCPWVLFSKWWKAKLIHTHIHTWIQTSSARSIY